MNNKHVADFFCQSELRKHNGATVIFVNGQPIMPMAFTSMDEQLSFDYIKRVADTGIKLFFQVCDLPWLNQEGLNINALRNFLAKIMELDNRLKIILRVNLHPSPEWLEANPDELVELSDGSKLLISRLSYYYRFRNIPMYSLVSQKWREDATKEMRKLVSMLPGMKGGENVIGIFLAAGSTGEWGYTPDFCDGLKDGKTIDYSMAFKKHFSQWLKNKYKNNQALQISWNQKDANLNNPGIPSLESRAAHLSFNEKGPKDFVSFDEKIRKNNSEYSIGGFINPATAQDAVDFYQAKEEGIAESMLYFAKDIKDFTQGKLLVGSFWGAYFQGGTRSRLLESEYIDFIASPAVYMNRRPGEITDTRILESSYHLHDKIFFVEDDTRTHLAANKIREKYKVFNNEDSEAQLKRDFGRNLCNNLYGWWFDMHPRKTIEGKALYDDFDLFDGKNWYDSPEILHLFKQQQKIANEAFKYDRSSVSDIAVIMDEKSSTSSSYLYSSIIQYWKFAELARSGMSIDFYYYDDLKNKEMPDYKFYIFANVYSINVKEREMINAKVKKNLNTVLWLYANGVINPDMENKFSVANIENLTDIKIKYDENYIEPEFTLLAKNNPLLKTAHLNVQNGGQNREILNNEANHKTTIKLTQMPNFYPDDNYAEILARFETNKHSALAVKKFTDWTSIYCAAIVISSDLLRSIARDAGCHIYCESDDFIFINKSFVTIHASSSGTKTLYFPNNVRLKEVYEGLEYCESSKKLIIHMEKGETKTFHII